MLMRWKNTFRKLVSNIFRRFHLAEEENPGLIPKNTVWRNEAFRGYADYTESAEFENGIIELTDIAKAYRTAYMCSEAVWWRCHRSIISDYLKERGWKVMHIMKENVATEHPYTSAFLQTHPQYVTDK